MAKKVIIIGGGLVGSLSACYFAKRGWHVVLYEKRPDLRLAENANLIEHRSINLAISERGFSSLRRLDPSLEARVKELVIPMHGRMVHTADGKLDSQAYDPFGKHINSVGRSVLIRMLLDVAETEYANVRLNFNSEFGGADFDAGTVEIKDSRTGERLTDSADLIVGADGAYSRVRQRIMGKAMVNYSQEYIEHGYIEFSLPPDSEGGFALDPNHLHIWPRKSFMLIALPNKDRSFTCTLFMPWAQLNRILSRDDVVALFAEHFADALALMGEDRVAKEYKANPKGSLVYVRCAPHNYKGRALIVGDSAHAMVPFYGQGMNCGFEDLEVLDRILVAALGEPHRASARTCELSSEELHRALDRYSEVRTKQASAIVDLALDNYVEMRSKVVSVSYLLRKKLVGALHRMFPKRIVPLYTMVSFTSIPYDSVVRRAAAQDAWISRAVAASAVSLAVGVAWMLRSRAPLISEMAKLLKKS